MWPDLIQRWLDRQRGVRAGNLPPLETYVDTLRYLAGGQPAVVQQPMKDGLYGTYDPKVPTIHGTIGGVPFSTEGGRMRDTITLNSAPQSEPLPYDFVLAHEMGHKLFNTVDPNTAQTEYFKNGGQQDILSMVGQLKAEGGNASEAFARTFAAAMEQVRHSGYKPPDWTMDETAPIYVNAMANWAKQRLKEYDARW